MNRRIVDSANSSLAWLVFITLLMIAALFGPAAALAHPPGITERASVSSTGGEGNSTSERSAISADGRFVAFASGADNLVPGDTNFRSDVFVHDRQTGSTVRVSVASDGTEGDGDSDWPTITPDGRFVAFESGADNLAPGDNDVALDIFLRDRQTGTTEGISLIPAGSSGILNHSSTPAITPD